MKTILVFLSIVSLTLLKNIQIKTTNKSNLRLILTNLSESLISFLLFFTILIYLLQHYQFDFILSSSFNKKVILISLLLTTYSSLSSIFFSYNSNKDAINAWGIKFSLSLIFQSIFIFSLFIIFKYDHNLTNGAIKAIPIAILAIVLMMIFKNFSFIKEDETLKKILTKDVLPVNSNLFIFSFIIFFCSSLTIYYSANIIVFILATALYLSKSKYRNIFELIIEHKNARFIYQIIIFFSAFLLVIILKNDSPKNILIILISSLFIIVIKAFIFFILKKKNISLLLISKIFQALISSLFFA